MVSCQNFYLYHVIIIKIRNFFIEQNPYIPIYAHFTCHNDDGADEVDASPIRDTNRTIGGKGRGHGGPMVSIFDSHSVEIDDRR